MALNSDLGADSPVAIRYVEHPCSDIIMLLSFTSAILFLLHRSLVTPPIPCIRQHLDGILSKDVTSMVKDLKKKGITVKDEPGVSLVRIFGPGVDDEKVCLSPLAGIYVRALYSIYYHQRIHGRPFVWKVH